MVSYPSASYCLDGHSIDLLGLTDSTTERLAALNIRTLERLACLALLIPSDLGYELFTLIQLDLRDRLQPYPVHCCVTSPNEDGKPAQFIIATTSFRFTAFVMHKQPKRYTCIYEWTNRSFEGKTPFHPTLTNRNTSRLHPMAKDTTQVIQGTLSLDQRILYNISTQDKLPTTHQNRPSLSHQAVNYNTPIQQLEMSTRTTNALLRGGICTIGQLASARDEKLLRLKNFGSKALQEVRDAIARLETTASQQVYLNETVITAKSCSQPQFSIPASLGHLPISVLELKLRTFNCLWRAKVRTLEDLGKLDETELFSIRNLGRKGVVEISEACSKLDIARLEQVAPLLPKFEDIPIDVMPLGSRVLNTLSKIEVYTLGDVIDIIDKPPLAMSETLGRSIEEVDEVAQALSIGKLKHIAARLQSHKSSSDTLETATAQREEIVHDDNASPQEVIDRFISKLDPRERQVIDLRYGLDGGEPRTLEQVGQVLDVTRERVRQIEQKALQRLRLSQGKIQPLILTLEQSLEQAYGVLSLDAAQDALYRDKDCSLIHPASLLSFVLCFTRQIEKVKDLSVLILKRGQFHRHTGQVVPTSVVLKRVLVEALTPIPLHEVLARLIADRDGQTLHLHLPQEFIVACLKAHPDIMVDEDGNYGLKQWANKRLDDMIIVLRQHGKPLHFTEIAKRVNQRLPYDQQTTARNVHGHVGRLPHIFVRVGHGIFGLAEWGLKQDRTVGDAAYRVLQEAGHPLSIDQITDHVLETWHVKRTSVPAAIGLDKRFVKVGYNLYWIADDPQTKDLEVPDNNFDVLFSNVLLERQAELQQADAAHDQVDALEEARRLGDDLFS